MKQNNKARKKEVLNYLKDNNIIILTDNDKRILATRKEEKWRNELAYVRSHLVRDGYLSNLKRNYWEITNSGEKYFEKLLKEYNKNSKRISTEIDFDSVIENNILLGDLDAFNLFEDNKEFKNEHITRQIELVKRYQSVIERLKNKYESKCQIEGCNFTFLKSNGEYYSEGHHLIALSQNGSQGEDNVIIICPNHHRMFHYAKVEVGHRSGNIRTIRINNEILKIIYK
jgi:predicted restriction endonuclease